MAFFVFTKPLDRGGIGVCRGDRQYFCGTFNLRAGMVSRSWGVFCSHLLEFEILCGRMLVSISMTR